MKACFARDTVEVPGCSIHNADIHECFHVLLFGEFQVVKIQEKIDRPGVSLLSGYSQCSLFIAYDCTDSVTIIVKPLYKVSTGVACRAENKDALLPIHAGSSSVAVERLIACDVALP